MHLRQFRVVADSSKPQAASALSREASVQQLRSVSREASLLRLPAVKSRPRSRSPAAREQEKLAALRSSAQARASEREVKNLRQTAVSLSKNLNLPSPWSIYGNSAQPRTATAAVRGGRRSLSPSRTPSRRKLLSQQSSSGSLLEDNSMMRAKSLSSLVAGASMNSSVLSSPMGRGGGRWHSSSAISSPNGRSPPLSPPSRSSPVPVQLSSLSGNGDAADSEHALLARLSSPKCALFRSSTALPVFDGKQLAALISVAGNARNALAYIDQLQFQQSAVFATHADLIEAVRALHVEAVEESSHPVAGIVAAYAGLMQHLAVAA